MKPPEPHLDRRRGSAAKVAAAAKADRAPHKLTERAAMLLPAAS